MPNAGRQQVLCIGGQSVKPICRNAWTFNRHASETKSWGSTTALRLWNGLLDHPAFQANVIEAERPVAGHRIIACGMGVFVLRAFASYELATQRPGLNSRILAGLAANEAVVLDRDQIAAGNAGDGVDFEPRPFPTPS